MMVQDTKKVTLSKAELVVAIRNYLKTLGNPGTDRLTGYGIITTRPHNADAFIDIELRSAVVAVKSEITS